MAYSEEEAARLLGLNSHQLRDERRRGRTAASQFVGRQIRYLREDLISDLYGHLPSEVRSLPVAAPA